MDAQKAVKKGRTDAEIIDTLLGELERKDKAICKLKEELKLAKKHDRSGTNEPTIFWDKKSLCK